MGPGLSPWSHPREEEAGQFSVLPYKRRSGHNSLKLEKYF